MTNKAKVQEAPQRLDDYVADRIISFLRNEIDTKIVLPEKESHEESKF